LKLEPQFVAIPVFICGRKCETDFADSGLWKFKLQQNFSAAIHAALLRTLSGFIGSTNSSVKKETETKRARESHKNIKNSKKEPASEADKKFHSQLNCQKLSDISWGGRKVSNYMASWLTRFLKSNANAVDFPHVSG